MSGVGCRTYDARPREISSTSRESYRANVANALIEISHSDSESSLDPLSEPESESEPELDVCPSFDITLPFTCFPAAGLCLSSLLS